MEPVGQAVDVCSNDSAVMAITIVETGVMRKDVRRNRQVVLRVNLSELLSHLLI